MLLQNNTAHKELITRFHFIPSTSRIFTPIFHSPYDCLIALRWPRAMPVLLFILVFFVVRRWTATVVTAIMSLMRSRGFRRVLVTHFRVFLAARLMATFLMMRALIVTITGIMSLPTSFHRTSRAAGIMSFLSLMFSVVMVNTVVMAGLLGFIPGFSASLFMTVITVHWWPWSISPRLRRSMVSASARARITSTRVSMMTVSIITRVSTSPVLATISIITRVITSPVLATRVFPSVWRSAPVVSPASKLVPRRWSLTSLSLLVVSIWFWISPVMSGSMSLMGFIIRTWN